MIHTYALIIVVAIQFCTILYLLKKYIRNYAELLIQRERVGILVDAMSHMSQTLKDAEKVVKSGKFISSRFDRMIIETNEKIKETRVGKTRKKENA